MANQMEYCDVKNTLLSINTSSTMETYDFVDDKVHVSETVISVNNFELLDHMQLHDKINEYEASTTLDNIKVELASPEGQYTVINDYVKIEEGISVKNIKIEYDNRLLYCEHCQAYYGSYCVECGMLVHILNKNAPDNSNKATPEGLPSDILEIQHLFGQIGTFTLKVIPEGVKFGPFTGLCKTECAWKIKGGKFVVDKDRSRYLNWMQYINPARNVSERNLIVLQCEDYIYYQGTRQIQPGEELLVYFGEEFEDSLNENVEVNFIPTTEHIVKDVFACTFCSLGYSTKSYLAKHKTVCRGDAYRNLSFEELVQCPFCNIHFGQKEYLENHFAYCSERNVRKCSAPTLNHQITDVSERKTRYRSPLYKCEQCKYRTNYKADLKKHTNNQHYKVKKCKCGICYRRFGTKEYLKLHMKNTHISVDRMEDPDHFKSVYINAQIKEEQSSLLGHIKRFNYSLSELRMKYKHALKVHTKTNHSKKFNFKCDSCAYGTSRKIYLVNHIKTKHLKKFDYKCDSCIFKTNLRSSLEIHIRSKHLREYNFKCDSCEFRTNRKDNLERHVKIIHLKQLNYKCDSCEYRTSNNNTLERHIRTFEAIRL